MQRPFWKFSLGDIAIICTVLLFLAAVSRPCVLGGKTATFRNACIANLKAIQTAKTEWAAQNQNRPTQIPLLNELFGTDKTLRHAPECPAGGQYTIGPLNGPPSCTFAHEGHEL